MNKLHIDLDKKIIDFVLKKTNIDIKENIEKIVCFALEQQNILVDDVYISINSATKDEIKKINKEYRNVDNFTDVLSFPIFEKEEYDNIKNQTNVKKKISQINLGDIILCLDVIEEHSKEYNTGLLREILYMITHGTAHLLGFDHIIDCDKKVMRNFEEEILKKIGVNNIDE